MYSQRTRNIIIGSVSATVVIIALVVLGITLYLTTDLFKSNETLFYKYASQTLESLKYVQNPQLAEIENLKDEKAYKVDGKLSYGASDLNTNSVNAHLEIQLAKNNPKQEAYANFDLIHNTETIFNVQYARSNNMVALKSPEIVNAFLGVKNENLQDLAEKLGVTNTAVLPNYIKDIKLNGLLNITEEQKMHINEVYLKVLEQNIDKNKFTKEKGLAVSRDGENYNTTAYRLTLTNEELKQVEIAILQALKEDDETLSIIIEKIEMLGLNKIEMNNLKSQIQNQINNINNSSVDPNSTGINIMLYASGGRIISTEIIYQNSIKCTVYGTATEGESKRYLLIENLNVDTVFEKMEINESETRNDTESTYNAIVNVNDETQVKVSIENIGSASQNKLTSNCKVEVDSQRKTKTISYTGEMTFDNNATQSIVKLNKTNCGVLNDYGKDQLKTLVEAVIEKTVEVVNQKLQTIGINKNNVEVGTEE